jgi:hypothetical protein
MRRIVLATLILILSGQVDAGVLYQQPPNPAGGFYRSSWWDPDGSNYDEYVWDRFILGSDGDIDSVQWRGAYDPAYGGDSPVVNFTVAIYGSIVGGSEPDLAHPPLVEYETGDNAGETAAGVFGGLPTYDYRFELPAPFQAQADVPYWVQIEGWQWGFPGWSIAQGTGGDGSHFRCQHVTAGLRDGPPTGCWFTRPTGDAAFTLLSAIVTGVEAPEVAAGFALEGILPNPTRGDRIRVAFTLPSAAPAKLFLFDVTGRQQAAMAVGGLGAGPHLVDLVDQGAITPGIYFVRLSQGARSEIAKVVVIH